jgi:cysteine desulfuration protein SufE
MFKHAIESTDLNTSEMSIQIKEKEVIEAFELFEDALDKYELIIEMGKQMPVMDEMYRTDELLVKGCQSQVWLRAYKQDDKIFYEADSNTVITKGIIALLVKILSGESAQAILAYDLHVIDAIQLKEHLTSQRSNGLASMVQKMKFYASIL